MKKFWDDHSLALVLALLFIVSWVGQFFFQLTEVTNQAIEHGQEFSWSEFWPQFGTATFENWQSEFLQLLSFVVLTAYLMYRGSPESRDSDEKTEAALNRIERQLKALQKPKQRRS